MQRGPQNGNIIHAICAKDFYDVYPRLTAPPVALHFRPPPVDKQVFVRQFLTLGTGNVQLFHLNAVAGSGKTNLIVWTVSLMRAAGLKFIILVYGVKAKGELLARGVRANEVLNFHSYFMRIMKQHVGALLEQARLLMSHMPSKWNDNEYVNTSKLQLVIAFHFREHPIGEALTSFYRPFLSALCDKARVSGFGCEGKPSCMDAEALESLVTKYRLLPKLEIAWTTLVNQPEKLSIERIVGDTLEVRLEYGLMAAGYILELSHEMSIQTEVQGATGMYNAAMKTVQSFPCVDYIDTEIVVRREQFDMGSYDRMLIDEGQDSNTNMLHARTAIRPGGKVMIVDDDAQSAFLFAGAAREERLALYETPDVVETSSTQNFRSGRLIVAEAQAALSNTGSKLIIEPMLDIDGEVIHEGTFHAAPIDSTETTLIVARTVAHLLVFYCALLFKGYRVFMHNMPDTLRELLRIVDSLPGTLANTFQRLQSTVACGAAKTGEVTYDLHVALLAAMSSYDALNKRDGSDVDFAMPDAKKHFKAWLYDAFDSTSDCNILLTSLHTAKGLSGGTTYIVNPSLCPLEDRLALGGHEEYEELCLAYIARSRAHRRMVYLKDLDSTSRSEVLGLFDAPIQPPLAAAASMPDSQETADTADPDSGDDEAPERQIADALAMLGLTMIPETWVALDSVVRRLLLANHPDRHNQSTESKEKTQAILRARVYLKSKIESASKG